MAKGKKKAGKKAKKASGNSAAKPKKAKEKKPAKEAAPKPEKKEGAKASPELEELRKVADKGKAEFEKAKTEADALRQQASELESKAKTAYQKAIAPYREACRKAGVECEYAGSRGASVTERVRFLVEKVKDGIKVQVKDRPETVKVIPFDILKESINKAAYGYTDRFLGPREVIGNKGGGLSNRLRALMTTK